MRKTGINIIVTVMLLTLAGCASGSGASAGTNTTQQAAATDNSMAEASAQVQQDATAEVAVTTQDTVSTEDGAGEEESSAATDTSAQGTPVVYFTEDITAGGLVKLYEQLGFEPTGNLAVKVSTGEPPASNYLRQELIGELVSSLNGTYVECLTAYGGQRSSVAMAKQVAEDHGFVPFDLLDENGSMTLAVSDYKVISENYVGAGMANYDSMLVLSHFKGHQMAGFGGAIKNISIGLGSAEGKSWIHSGGKSKSNPWGGDQEAFTESMAEAADTVQDYYGDRIVYINVMNRLSIDCDCNGHPAEPDIHDIGILASYDPVALDQACYDLILQAEGNESFVSRVESRMGIHTLEHAEAIGLGSRTYELVKEQ